MRFHSRYTPPEFMDNELFYQSSIRPFKIAKARYKYYKDIKNREIQIKMLLNKIESINVLDVGALGGIGKHLLKYEKYFNFFYLNLNIMKVKLIKKRL